MLENGPPNQRCTVFSDSHSNVWEAIIRIDIPINNEISRRAQKIKVFIVITYKRANSIKYHALKQTKHALYRALVCYSLPQDRIKVKCRFSWWGKLWNLEVQNRWLGVDKTSHFYGTYEWMNGIAASKRKLELNSYSDPTFTF